MLLKARHLLNTQQYQTITTVFRHQTARGMKIYTKTGDKGQSSLFTGERLDKNHHIFECLGSIDELNAQLGMSRDYCSQMVKIEQQYPEQLEEIQTRLIDLGSHIATPRKSDEEQEKKIAHTTFDTQNVEYLEKWIDEMDLILPPLKNFILPSGGLAASSLHVARTICRRAERNLIPLLQEDQIDAHAYKYVNRLSDYLFTLARTCAHIEGKPEVIYKKAKKHE